jgi:predicted cupin superfamily sugar epimerase
MGKGRERAAARRRGPGAGRPSAAAAKLIAAHGLAQHPEGGYFKETYRASARLPGGTLPGFPGERRVCTAIFFLLPRGTRSLLHRLKSDEIWHFHLGGPLRLVSIDPAGRVESVALGADADAGQKLQHVVPAGHWFGARAEADDALVGCTVSPGFDFADFEIGRRDALLALFPGAREAIELLTEPVHG